MLTKLPTELLWIVFSFLSYDDLEILLTVRDIEAAVRQHLQCHYKFHYEISSMLGHFEALTPTERRSQQTRAELATQLLQRICRNVETCPKFDHRAKFTHLLQVLQNLVVKRVLSPELRPGLENDYASLCLEVRHIYLHTPSIRVLHDSKYRRRSTKYPLAPFLPRDYTWVWRSLCASAAEFFLQKRVPSQLFRLSHHQQAAGKQCLLDARNIRLRFARFFGSLFELTGLYLESNLDGTFEECVREALVSGDVESLLVMCRAAGREVDVEGMIMMVTHAGEQLWSYLDTMEDLLTHNPTPSQRARIEGMQEDELLSPPDWFMPSRYKVHPDAKLRLKLMDKLYKNGWRWF